VLLNLCVNARDAMPEGGTLSLSASNLRLDEQYAGMNLDARPGPHVLIQIEDSGCGIPAGDIDALFNPTFSTKTNHRGHGLGLFMVAQFAKRTGAAVSIESTPGSGTRFTLAVPTSDGQTEAT
jgi:signal transduction histidine kinase